MFTIRADRHISLVEFIGSFSLVLGVAIWLEANLETQATLIGEDA